MGGNFSSLVPNALIRRGFVRLDGRGWFRETRSKGEKNMKLRLGYEILRGGGGEWKKEGCKERIIKL